MNRFPIDFFGAGNEIKPSEVSPLLQALLDNWQASILSGGIGFLPRLVGQRTYWYAFAPTPRQRRELLGLLDAWVGPTYSDLALGRGELETTESFDAALAGIEVAPLRFEVLPRVAPESRAAKEAVRDALITLTRLANGRPPSQFDAMRTTVEILDDLGHAVAARDRALADACMKELEQSADLDESNLAFLRLRIYAGMRDWGGIFADQALEQVLSMRRPLAVTRVIQTGLYYERFRDLDHSGNESELRSAAEQLEPALRDLHTGAPPNNRPEAVIELLCRLLVTPSATDPAVVQLLNNASRVQTGLDDQLRGIIRAFDPEATNVLATEPAPLAKHHAPSPLEQVASLLLQGDLAGCIELGAASEPSVENGRALVVAARQLASAKWANIVADYLLTHDLMAEVAATNPVLREQVGWLESIRGETPLRGWKDWLTGLENPGHQTTQLSSEAVQSWETLSKAELLTALAEASESALSRLGETGGQFFAAHSHLFTSPDAAEIALRLIAAMALSGKASAGIRVQTLSLCESLTAVSSPPSTLVEFLEWAAEILDANVSATTASWACDILQTVTAIPISENASAILTFYYRTIDALRPYRSALDVADVGALEVVASELGAVVPADFQTVSRATEDPKAAYSHLEAKTVVLHSLTETAITRASQVLKRLVDSIDVRTNSEHDGSPQLAQLSANADLFVVVTASAKHAATTFIDGHRRGRPTVLVNSRGSSAILRELADFRF